ncbi:MAG: molybdopterin-dependent oxidoreductase, partial [Acidobacteriota bacterium]|nr:molybdopterin-dependent oxidoreductase [Acidobacteriota bacterium]
VSLIAPNEGDHLNCDECGMCIDICPVGALTSGTYRYKTRPWEMEHAGTICTHCSNGCKTTLGVKNDQIIRGNNRDRSGINGEFLCIKGRYAFDFYNSPERLQAPLMRVNGKLEPVSWSQALATVAAKFKDVKAANGKFGIVGSNRTSNEENFYLQKFARQGLGTNNIDHHRTGDVVSLLDGLSGRPNATLATTDDLYNKKAILVIGSDLALQQPFLSFQIRANVRLHDAHLYVVTPHDGREGKYAVAGVRAPAGQEFDGLETLREKLRAEPELVVLFGDCIQGEGVRKLLDFGTSLGIPVQYCCLLDYSNSRGAVDMGLTPDLLPGFHPAPERGLTVSEMLSGDLDALWVVGANPFKSGVPAASGKRFLVVNEMFLTETAQAADVVFPAASAYEKSGTVTNVCGQVQRLKKAIAIMGTKPDLEIMGLIAKEMGIAPLMGPWLPDTVFQEIRRTVRGYDISLPLLEINGALQTMPVNGRIPGASVPAAIRSANDNLFTSGTLGRYSKILNSVMERRQP